MRGKATALSLFTLTFLLLTMVPIGYGEWNEVSRVTYSGSAEQQVVLTDWEDNIHLIYQENLGGRIVLKYLKLDSAGVPIVPTHTIASGTGESMYPSAVLDGSGIHVIWWDSRSGNFRMYYTLLSLNGTRIMGEKPLDVELAEDNNPAEAPESTLDPSGNTHVVWSQKGNEPDDIAEEESLTVVVYYMQLDLYGDVVIPQLKISSGYANAINPDIELDTNKRAHIVWSEDITGNYEIYYTVLSDLTETSIGGQDSNVIRLTDTPRESVMPCIQYHRNRIHITWSDGGSSGDQYALHYGFIGVAGLEMDVMISSKGNAFYPSMRSHGSLLHITWQDDRHALGGSQGRDTVDEMKDNITSMEDHLKRHLYGEQVYDAGGEFTNWEIYYTTIDTIDNIQDGSQRISAMERSSLTPEIVVGNTGEITIVWVDMAQSSGDLYHIDTTEESDDQSISTLAPEEESLLLIGGIGLFIIFYVLSGEGRRYTMYKFFLAPLYSTISRDRLMENDNRRQIVDLINARQGITFTNLMDELGLKNGALAYHLYTLERRRYIKSVKDGKYRRFYPRGAQVSPFSSLEERIIGVIRNHPSISQREIATLIESTPQTVNYNIKKLIERGVVYLQKDGKQTKCHLSNPNL